MVVSYRNQALFVIHLRRYILVGYSLAYPARADPRFFFAKSHLELWEPIGTEFFVGTEFFPGTEFLVLTP